MVLEPVSIKNHKLILGDSFLLLVERLDSITAYLNLDKFPKFDLDMYSFFLYNYTTNYSLHGVFGHLLS